MGQPRVQRSLSVCKKQTLCLALPLPLKVTMARAIVQVKGVPVLFVKDETVVIITHRASETDTQESLERERERE